MSTKIHTTAEALRYLKKGRAEGMDFLFCRYYTRLTLFANKIVQNQLLAEELAASSFIKLWQRRRKFKENSQIKLWLYTAVHDSAISYLSGARSWFSKEPGYCDKTNDIILNAIIYAETIDSIIGSSGSNAARA